MSFHRFPVELQDLVIESLSHDRRSLLKASLTCRAWRLICYRHLFSSIKLDLRSIPSFYELLHNQFTQVTIPLCVRQLYIDLYTRKGKGYIEGSRSAPLLEILMHLSRAGRVVHLSLSNIHSSDFHVYSILSSGFTKIRSLHLSGSSFTDLAAFRVFIAAYTQVEQVLLRNIQCPIPDSTLLPPTPPMGSYGLQISASVDLGFHTSLKWHRTTSAEHVESLEQLGVISLVHSDNINWVLQVLGSSLHCLEFMYPAQNVTTRDSIPYELNLHHTTCLQYLSLGFPDRVLGVMPWILSILHRLRGSSLRRLRISFSASQQFILDIPFLKLLCKVLAESQFRKLQLLHFFTFNTFGDKEAAKLVVKHVSESLFSWHEEGKLRFTFPS